MTCPGSSFPYLIGGHVLCGPGWRRSTRQGAKRYEHAQDDRLAIQAPPRNVPEHQVL